MVLVLPNGETLNTMQYVYQEVFMQSLKTSHSEQEASNCISGDSHILLRFKSLHCLLYPQTDWCVKRKAWVEAHMGGRTPSDRCKGW